MPKLRDCKFVDRITSVQGMAKIAGISGAISVRILIDLLGNKLFGSAPIYILGHNTNTISKVKDALQQGANALEVDVTAYEFNLQKLCFDHAGLFGNSPGGADAPSIDDFLNELCDIANGNPQLALVVFDCKPPAATPALGPQLLAAIRQNFSEKTGVNVIISVADVTSSNPYRLDGTSIFDKIALDIGPREGFMIDEDGSPEDVTNFFHDLGVSRFCYGNGTSDPLSDEGAMVYRTPIERACWTSVSRNEPRFIYAWTVNDSVDQELYLQVGVNGMICDPNGISNLRAILDRQEFAGSYRIALRTDNPFLPPNAAYGLSIVTSDIDQAGTDANLTFRLTGVNGTASITFSANFNARMEKGQTNFVVLPAPDLGTLQSITVSRDDSGNAPDWHLASIDVESYRYTIPKKAKFDCWIETPGTFTRVLMG